MAILKLPGGTALSDFRLEKLNATVGSVCPGLRVTTTQLWHFVEVEREPTHEEQRTLDRLVTGLDRQRPGRAPRRFCA